MLTNDMNKTHYHLISLKNMIRLRGWKKRDR